MDWNPPVEVKILDQRLHDWGLPDYQSEGAAAIDLYACLEADLVLPAASPAALIPSGIAVNMGSPHMAAITLPRSGLGHKEGLVLGNLQGLIDPDYSGEIMISAWNRNPAGTEAIVIRPGQRIAQMVFFPVLRPHFQTVKEFSHQTVRGPKGFGSTGDHSPGDSP